MPSVLNVDTIADAAGTGPVALTKQQAAKAWVNYDQRAPAVRNSFNVSSATDVSTGIGTMNWTNSFSNATYSPVVMGDADATSHWTSASTRSTLTGANAVFTTSAHQFIMHNIGGSVTDSYYTTGQYLGDLA